MSIRAATLEDNMKIASLLDQLNYPVENSLLKNKIGQLINHPDHHLLVFEDKGEVLAMMSIHFVPQVALQGDFAIISYLAVDEGARNSGIGKELEEHCVQLAKDHNCDRIQVHCHIRRVDAHRFYERQGYQESRKYFSKKLG